MKKNLLKFTLIAVVFSISTCLASCNLNANTASSSSGGMQGSSKSLNDCITWLADKKTDNSKYTLDVKIPQINIDKPGAKSINEEIKAKFYTNDVQSALNGGFEGIKLYIRTESSLNGSILSIRIKQELYPSYGTDGDVYSVCYDIDKDILVTPAQYLKDKGYDYQKVIANAKADFEKQTTEPIEYFNAQGIYINDKGQVEVVLNVVTHPPKSDSWKVIYYYTVK